MKKGTIHKGNKKMLFYRNYVKAVDDWYPSFDDGTVLVAFNPHSKVLSVSGNDDFAMFKENATRGDYMEVCSLPISKERMKSLGLKPD